MDFGLLTSLCPHVDYVQPPGRLELSGKVEQLRERDAALGAANRCVRELEAVREQLRGQVQTGAARLAAAEQRAALLSRQLQVAQR